MRTVQALIGLPVISNATGIEHGRVVDALFDGKEVVGLTVKRTHLFAHHAFLPIGEIAHAGQEAVMIAGEQALKPVNREQKMLHPIHTGRRRFKGKPLLSEEGETLGLVEDVYFNVELGTIIGYEVTDGWLSDIKEGRKVVKGQRLVISKERAILSL
ncbi:hypothetical protein J26TS2_03610 [Shouchella clausii]|uniref:PRC-barrel domain-containing protein n=1 Tax=Shouchella tritolerans TaxID=2979466 RepID=UPI000786EC22|nr:PRC-barrel domain-containing protein [Shouchella tritolerans]GIN10494.1 hypothetical protein J26TS2_03610 [Shouchella clausii]